MRLRALISRRSPSPPKPSVVTRGLVDWFDFSDGKGTETTLKSRVSDNVLTLSGFNFDENSGWTGKGLKFDGVDDIGELPHRTDFEAPTMTIEFSFLSLKNRFAFKKGPNAGENTSYGVLENGGLLYGYVVDSGSSKTPPSEIRPVSVENKTQVITLVLDSGTACLYVNGVFLWSYTSDKVFSVIEKGSFTIGQHAKSTSSYQKGISCSAKIHNVALTTEEIAQNYEYEQSIDRTTVSTYPMLQEQKSYGIGLANQLSEEQKASFRLNVDGTKFVAGLRYCECLEVEEFTYSEIQVEMEKEEWSKIEELE